MLNSNTITDSQKVKKLKKKLKIRKIYFESEIRNFVKFVAVIKMNVDCAVQFRVNN